MKKPKLSKNVKDLTWEELKLLALQNDVTMGEMLEVLLNLYLEEIKETKK